MSLSRRVLFIAVLAAGGCAIPVNAQPTQPALRRIVAFLPRRYGVNDDLNKPFFDEMQRLGWVEGQNIAYDRVYADDRMESLPQLAADIVARKPELILALSPPLAGAMKRATASIPMVFAVVVDPVGSGLVESLARPGGNATGITQSVAESLAPKRLDLLLEALPGIKRIGVLGNTSDPGSVTDQAALAPAASARGVSLIVANGTNPSEFDASVARLIEQRVQAIIVANGIAIGRRVQMIEMTAHARIAVIGFNHPMADAGALMSFGPSITDQIRRAALVVNKILRGAKPADIPVEAANLIELVDNQQSAKALGVKIPHSIVLRADRVIE